MFIKIKSIKNLSLNLLSNLFKAKETQLPDIKDSAEANTAATESEDKAEVSEAPKKSSRQRK